MVRGTQGTSQRKGSATPRGLKPAARSLSKVRWVRGPEQARSRATLDRVLDTAEAMLERTTFEQLSVAELVRKARSSIGAFYTRFSDKEALLDALYDRHQEQAVGRIDELFSTARWKGVPLPQVIEELVRFVVRFHREHKGLLRTLVLRGYAKPDPRYADPSKRAMLSVARAGELVASRGREIRHPNPKLAGQMGFLMVLGVLREKVLFPSSTGTAAQASGERLVKELTRAYTRYLDVR